MENIDKMNVAVLIPVYNEKDNLQQLIDSIKDLDLEQYYFYFIDDGSTDGSFDDIEIALDNHKIIKHRKNFGLATSVKTGIEAALLGNAEYIVKVDADLQHDLRELESLVIPLKNKNSDIVYGDRFSGSINYKMGFIRKYGNKFFSYLMRRLTKFNIIDSQPGFISFTREVAESIKLLGSYNYTQQILLEAAISGFTFSQVPISFNERKHGESFISYKYPFKVFFQIFLIYSSLKPLQTFGKIGMLFITSGLMVAIYQMSRYYLDISEKLIVNDGLVSLLMLFGIQTVFVGILGNLFKNIK